MSGLAVERDVLSDLAGAASREWLVTNGLGGYAAGTIAGLNTRRYHGLLVAALRPPVQRNLLVSRIDATATYQERRWELGTNEYGDGTIHPHGYLQLESFRLAGLIPVWLWRIGDALLEQRIWMRHGFNTTYVSYALVSGSGPIDLALSPLCTHRDYHWQHRGHRDIRVETGTRDATVWAEGARPFRLAIEGGECIAGSDWHWNFSHRVERERGLDAVEDLFRPARFHCLLSPGDATALVLTAEAGAQPRADVALHEESERQARLLALADCSADDAILGTLKRAQLVLAADQFVVARQDSHGDNLGQTVIAGYPWFSDWGRDTMIALPGLLLATGRSDVATRVLRTFAQFVSEGMLPNRFPDDGAAPEYNTVDATLWYVVAVEETVRRTSDVELLRSLFPALRNIVDWHLRGARYGIHVDASDGLLYAGEPGLQLTWMDAKIGDWVVTPRQGKPVEINALWFNVLVAMRDFAALLGLAPESREYGAAADRVALEFNARFWNGQAGCLFDVIDAPAGQAPIDAQGRDPSLRPNQLFAVSLRHRLLDDERARAVVDICARELWTPVGLRSLASTDPRYAGHYRGGPDERDAVYHQGTVWSWLLGPFASAHYRVYRDAPRARGFLSIMNAHLRAACIGQVSEVFDGNAPFTPRGCFAQAWGVAEILRAWSDIDANESLSLAR